MAEAAQGATQGVGSNTAGESPEEIQARKEREKNELYALDISGAEWHSAPGTEDHEERVEIAYLPRLPWRCAPRWTPRPCSATRRRSGRRSCWGLGTGSSIWRMRRGRTRGEEASGITRGRCYRQRILRPPLRLTVLANFRQRLKTRARGSGYRVRFTGPLLARHV